jgi:hypothetical protein
VTEVTTEMQRRTGGFPFNAESTQTVRSSDPRACSMKVETARDAMEETFDLLRSVDYGFPLMSLGRAGGCGRDAEGS